jgi:3-O-methylgallate 3,4-dioxygenase
MAEIIIGIGTSHGPLLATPPEEWHQRRENDQRVRAHPFRGGSYSFDELVALRAAENLPAQITLEVKKERYAACQAALDHLGEVWAASGADIAVIFGNDQMEIFDHDQIPGFAVYYGAEIPSTPLSAEELAKKPPGIAIAEVGYRPREPRAYPGLPALGEHLIASLVADGFDIAASNRLPGGKSGIPRVPHAYGFVYERIMRGKVVPNVPVLTNTFYAPNQPRVARCIAMGRAAARAILSWNSDLRVGLFGSGGLSHYAIDEVLDRRVLDAMRRGDTDSLRDLPENQLLVGTSEIKNWLPLAAASEEAGLKMNFVDYVPCYRSEAGTGNAMGFAAWSAA